jgi:lipopolysaccharide export system protein LptC
MPRTKTAKRIASESGTAARPRRDWTARTRGTVLDAFRYSQFVTLMKRALPLAAAAVLAAVLVYSLLPRQPDRVTMTFEQMGTIENDLAMVKPRLTGSDDDGNPFVITAAVAIQDPKHPRRGRMKKIEADMTLENGRWLNAEAAEGYFDMDANNLKLRKGISLYTDAGYELHTASVDVDMKRGLFHGPGEVTGHGPLGALRADRFDVDHNKQLLHLVGNVKMTFSTVRTHPR